MHAGIVNCDPWAADGVVRAVIAWLLLLLLFMYLLLRSLEKGV